MRLSNLFFWPRLCPSCDGRINNRLRHIEEAIKHMGCQVMGNLSELNTKATTLIEQATALQQGIDSFQAVNTNLQALYDATAAELQALKDAGGQDPAALESLTTSLTTLGDAITTMTTDVGGGNPAPEGFGRRG